MTLDPNAEASKAWSVPRTSRPRSVLALIFIATVMMGLSATMLNIALPHIVRDLNASTLQANWMLLSYLLVSAPAIVLMGQVADSGDQRFVFLGGVALFSLASLCLGAVSSPLSFSVLRGIQALGGAAILSTAAAMIAAIWPPSMLSGPMGVYLAGFAIAQVAGPIVGGIVSTLFGWRLLFWIVVPFGVVAVAWGWRLLDDLPASATPLGLRIDVPGNALLFVALGSMLFAFSRTQQFGWLDSHVLIPCAASGLLLLFFLGVERRVRYPAISWDLLRNRAFSFGNTAAFMMVVPRLVLPVLMGLYFQGIVGDSALTAALLITPIAAMVTAGSLLAARLADAKDERRVAVEQTLLGIAGLALLTPALVRDWPIWTQLLGMGVVGFSTGVFSTVNASILLRAVPANRAGNVNAVRAMLQTAGLPFGTGLTLSLIVGGVPAAMGQAFLSGRAATLDAATVDQLRLGFALAMGAMALMAAVAAVAGVLLLRTSPVLSPLLQTAAAAPAPAVPVNGTPDSSSWSVHSSFRQSVEPQGE